MRFFTTFCLLLIFALAGCQTVPSEPEHQRLTGEMLAELEPIPPLMDRPRPNFRQISYRVSGEGTIGRVDLIVQERREAFDVFEVVNHMPHGQSTSHWVGYAGLAHLLVTPKSLAPGSVIQSYSKVVDIETWDGELFPIAVGNRLEVMQTTRNTLYNLRTGQYGDGENTCLFTFEVVEELVDIPDFYSGVEGPFYAIQQIISCTGEPPVMREIIFAPSLGCPMEITTVNADGNVLSYRRLESVVQEGEQPRRGRR